MESDAAVVTDHFFYNQGGVQLSLGSHVPLLTYHSHDHEIRRRLKPGKPTRTSGSFTEDDVGLQVFTTYRLRAGSFVILVRVRMESRHRNGLPIQSICPMSALPTSSKAFLPLSRARLCGTFLWLCC